MSIQALAWVFKQKLRPASLKLTLIAFADCASDQMHCWPSIAHLEAITSLDRKTILQNVEYLIRAGLLVDSGERKGRTKSIKVYRLHIPSSPEIGTTKQSRFSLEAVPKTDAKQSQKRDTEPLYEPLLNLTEKNDFEKKLMSAGFLERELFYLSTHEAEIKSGIHILHVKSKFAKQKLEQNCSYKLNEIFPNWRIEVGA